MKTLKGVNTDSHSPYALFIYIFIAYGCGKTVAEGTRKVAGNHVFEQVGDDHRVLGLVLMTYSWTLLAPRGLWEYTKQMQEGKREGWGGGKMEGKGGAMWDRRERQYLRTVVEGWMIEGGMRFA